MGDCSTNTKNESDDMEKLDPPTKKRYKEKLKIKNEKSKIWSYYIERDYAKFHWNVFLGHYTPWCGELPYLFH